MELDLYTEKGVPLEEIESYRGRTDLSWWYEAYVKVEEKLRKVDD
jgi:hypothetical protein